MLAKRYKKGQRGKCGEEKDTVGLTEVGENVEKEKEGACIGKQAAGVLPYISWVGEGRVAAGGDAPNSRVGAHKWLC